jgi:predicted ester cyclase
MASVNPGERLSARSAGKAGDRWSEADVHQATRRGDWHEEVVELVSEGHTVAGRFRCSGTHLGEFLGEAPTGKRMEVEEVFFLRVEDGRFVDFWGLEDSLGRMRQLGLLPPGRHAT